MTLTKELGSLSCNFDKARDIKSPLVNVLRTINSRERTASEDRRIDGKPNNMDNPTMMMKNEEVRRRGSCLQMNPWRWMHGQVQPPLRRYHQV